VFSLQKAGIEVGPILMTSGRQYRYKMQRQGRVFKIGDRVRYSSLSVCPASCTWVNSLKRDDGIIPWKPKSFAIFRLGDLRRWWSGLRDPVTNCRFYGLSSILLLYPSEKQEPDPGDCNSFRGKYLIQQDRQLQYRWIKSYLCRFASRSISFISCSPDNFSHRPRSSFPFFSS